MKLKIALSIMSLVVMSMGSSSLFVGNVRAHHVPGQPHHHPLPGGPHHRPVPPRYRPALPPRRWYRGVWGPYPYATDKAFKYFGITAVALGFLDLLNAEQQREHEAALIAAASRPGEEIIWESNGASGSVQATRVGVTTSGRQCREFQQTVTVGGRTEQAYGTACLQPDGSWEIINTQ